ncbi:geranylgeranylglycerol-phosphate geranylgeranyltransferase [Bacteroidota bacterium]
MKSFLSLIRLPNLLVIAFTQFAMKYLVMDPLLPSASFSLQFSNIHFLLLVLATLLIAAAGYIINDYFDTRPDRINKPSRVVIGVSITRRTAMTLHSLFNILGIGIGIYLSISIGLLVLSMIFMLTTGLLWFYSTNYKRQLLIGNLIIAFLTSMVPVVIVLFEIPMLNKEYGQVMLQYDRNFMYIFFWVGGFGLFAFLTTLIREIIKDAKDFEGDAAYGMRSLPIVVGTKATKGILAFLILTTLFLLVFVLIKFIMFSGDQVDFISLIYFMVFLVLPLFVLLTLILVATNKTDYHRAGIVIKIIMLFGVLYSFVVYYLINFWL